MFRKLYGNVFKVGLALLGHLGQPGVAAGSMNTVC